MSLFERYGAMCTAWYYVYVVSTLYMESKFIIIKSIGHHCTDTAKSVGELSDKQLIRKQPFEHSYIYLGMRVE